MKPAIATLWLAFLLLACSPASPPSLSFEIKEFKTQHTFLSTLRSTSYSGKGTVVAADPYFQTHNAELYVRYKVKHQSGQIREGLARAILEKGSGEITTYDSFPMDKDDDREPEYGWTAIGYHELLPAEMNKPR